MRHDAELRNSHQTPAGKTDGSGILFEAMKAETVQIGERLFAEEAEFDRLFATREIIQETLTAATATIGNTQAILRAAHLKVSPRDS